MDRMGVHFALHGVFVLLVSVTAGLLLYRAILRQRAEGPWHLVHAGGTVRAVLLISLAAIVERLPFSASQLETFVWLMIFSIWASMLAMVLAAASGQRGLRFAGAGANRVVYVLYGLHIVTLFPACILLAVVLLAAL